VEEESCFREVNWVVFSLCSGEKVEMKLDFTLEPWRSSSEGLTLRYIKTINYIPPHTMAPFTQPPVPKKKDVSSGWTEREGFLTSRMIFVFGMS